MVTMMVLVASGLAYAEPATLEPPKPPKQEDEAAKKAEELVKPYKEAYDRSVQVAKDKYKKVLEAEFDKATKAGNLEDAKAIQKEMEESNGEEGKWKNQNIKIACKRYLSEKETAQMKLNSEVDKLVMEWVRKKEIEIAEAIKTNGLVTNNAIGKWHVVIYDKTQKVVWNGTFELLADHTAKNSGGHVGTWSLKDNNVFVNWGSGRWESFNLPLNSDVVGKSWSGADRVLKAQRLKD
jgi:hypothetical protein